MNKRNRGTAKCPNPNDIKIARGSLTQKEASDLIYTTQARWSDYENGKSRMHPAVWELFLIKSKDDFLRNPYGSSQ